MRPPDVSRILRSILTDRSAWTLLAANAVTLVVALVGRWDIRPLLWVYWGQSVIIGAFNFIRMITLTHFTTEGLTSNDQPVPATSGGKYSTAVFFAFHYGFFHLVYLVFLAAEFRPTGGRGTWSSIALCLAAFLLNHLFSFRQNQAEDQRRVLNLGTLLFFPYARILPMHLTIILGAALTRWLNPLLIFLPLKTLADLIMHATEHAGFRKLSDAGGAAPPPLPGSPLK